MRNFILVLLFVGAICFDSRSQENSEEGYTLSNESKTKASKSERLIVNFFVDFWQKRHDSISFYGLNRSFSLSLLDDIRLGYTNFSLGWGFDVTSYNIYSDAIPTDMYDTSVYVFPVTKPLLDYTTWVKIPQYVNGHKIDFSINKFNTTYLEFPLEFRYKNRSKYVKRIKCAIGAKFGLLISSHTKYVGDDYTNNIFPSRDVKFKWHNIPNLSKYRYGLTARFSIGYLGVSFYYALSPLFDKDKGIEMFPISIGIALVPF